ncbi:PIN-like domain-containing protein [Peribacillus sp. SCS-37]|uniref:PIN-like domain-containing protein n=1 Tax=Paraperibacillus esterisolvens TaxID=3115296 RepID=UPI0039069890
MEAYEKYFVYPSQLNELYKKGAVIVPDTNFLLAAYQWRDITTEKVKQVLEQLSKHGQLIIPEQILYEFTKNRHKILAEQINSINDEMKRFNDPKKSMKEFIPTAEQSVEVKAAQDKRDKLAMEIQDYKNTLKELKKKISDLIVHDDYFDFIKTLCRESFLPYSKDKSILIDEGLKRISLGIKPGTHESKSDPTGDYIIWSEIMNLKQDVIFVSNDEKKDWVYKSKDGQSFGTDQLLLAEYFSNTEGKSFIQVSAVKFLKYMDPKLNEAIEVDLEKTNSATAKNLVPFAVSSSSLSFGKKPGDIREYWEFKLDRTPTPEDFFNFDFLFKSVMGATRANVFILFNEIELDYSIIIDLSDDLGMLSDKEVLYRIRDLFNEELILAKYQPPYGKVRDYALA